MFSTGPAGQSRPKTRRIPTLRGHGLRLLGRLSRKQLVTDVSRGGRQLDASRLAPDRPVYLLLVTDLQFTRRLAGNEDRITHLAPGSAISLPDFLPQFEPAKFEPGKFFLDLATNALLVALTTKLSPAGKHPAPVAPASDQKDATALDSHQFGRLSHPRHPSRSFPILMASFRAGALTLAAH